MLKALLSAAILPAALLMAYVYRLDTIEKEPWPLLRRLVVLGALCCVPASLLEQALLGLLPRAAEPETLRYALLQAFVCIALVEEGLKFAVLRLTVWRSPEFNYRFDGIVYAVFTGLGFAALENIVYALHFGPSVLMGRGLLSIPGHATFGVYMGLFLAQAKLADLYGAASRRGQYLCLSLGLPVLLHGFFDFCLMSGSTALVGVFLMFVVVLDVASIVLLRRQSRRDGPLI